MLMIECDVASVSFRICGYCNTVRLILDMAKSGVVVAFTALGEVDKLFLSICAWILYT